MKIGILTFHRALNYGAVLQVYALQATLQELGCNVEIIDYRPKCIEDPYKVFNIRNFLAKNPLRIPKKVVLETLLLNKRKRRYNRFGSFDKRCLSISSRAFTDIEDFPLNYDCYIIGSDQIWNEDITKGFDPIYWGDFKCKLGEGQRVISYAASRPVRNLDDKIKEGIRLKLRNFDTLSVREQSLNDQLSSFSEVPITTVLDPTLLKKGDFWSNISKKPKEVVSGKFILCYKVMESNVLDEVLLSLFEATSLSVVHLTQGVPMASLKKGYYADASPEEFLWLIQNAEYVVTTSFHATVFSILFKKIFFVVPGHNAGGDSRSRALLSTVGLDNRFVSSKEDITLELLNEPIDFDRVNKILDCEREKAMSFLHKAIGGE